MGYVQLSGGVYRYEDMISDRIDSYIPMNFDCIYDFANISTVGTDIVLDVTPVAAGCPNHRATGSQNCKVSEELVNLLLLEGTLPNNLPPFKVFKRLTSGNPMLTR